jgi:hypothetical protein
VVTEKINPTWKLYRESEWKLVEIVKETTKTCNQPDLKLEEGMVEDSMNSAIEIDKGKIYAQILRRRKREWTQSRTLPP